MTKDGTDFEAEYEQLGRNTAGKCQATFVTILRSKTADPRLIAAAMRGRAEVFEDGAIVTDDVQILINRGPVVVARVRDDQPSRRCAQQC